MMDYQNFEKDFLKYLKKNNGDCIPFIEENESMVQEISTNPDKIKCLVNKINDTILSNHPKDLSLYQSVFKHPSFQKIYSEFKKSDILIRTCQDNEKNNTGFIEWILSMEVDSNLKDTTDTTASMYLAKNGKIPELKVLINHGADIHYKNNNNETVLSFLIKGMNAKTILSEDANSILECLSQNGADFNVAIDEDGTTAFMAILLLNSLFLPSDILMLVKRCKNIDLSLKNKLQENATSLLIKLNQPVLTMNLIKNKTFDWEYKNEENGNNLLMLSAMSQAQILDELLKKNKMKNKINDVNANQENALIIATKAGCVDSVKLLLKHHSNVNQQDLLGNTALHYAVTIGDKYLTKLILNKKANRDLENKEGYTPNMLCHGPGHDLKLIEYKDFEIQRSTYNIAKKSLQ